MMIDPRNMTVTDWTDSMVYILEKYGTVSRLDKEEYWQNWALGVVSFFEVGKQNPPNPLNYDDWRDWAFAFTRAVNLSG
jgi:hypothetical protein